MSYLEILSKSQTFYPDWHELVLIRVE